MNKNELAKLIQSFVAGKSNRWDWDDFISVKQKDSELEKIRLRLINIHKQYPPGSLGGYCNQDGIKILLEIAESLSGHA